jgi:tetratricopeptide (TPR) repeat protein
MRAALALAAIALLVGVARPARAEDKAAARAAYAEGTKYYDLNNFEAALKAFEKAYWNYEEPAFLFNIAQCYRQLDRKQDAVKFYRSYLRKVPEAPNRADVEKLIASLDEAIANEKRAAARAEPPANPTAPAAPPAPAQTAPANNVVVAAKPAPAPRGSRALRAAGIGVGVAGVAAIGLGAAFALLAKDANHQYLQPADGVYSPSADANRGTYQTAEVVTFTVGGAAIIAGTTMYLVGRRR